MKTFSVTTVKTFSVKTDDVISEDIINEDIESEDVIREDSEDVINTTAMTNLLTVRPRRKY